MHHHHPLLAVLFLSIMLAMPGNSHAATIAFDPQENTVGTHSTFLVGVTIDAPEDINALSLTLALSENFEVVDTSDGNSVMHLWLDTPQYDKNKHTLTFSGLFPGGYSGIGGRLITLTIRALRPGVGGIRVVAPSHIYLNTPDALDSSIDSQTLSIEATDVTNNLTNPILDISPPEAFTPVIASLPDSDTSEAWMLLYSTVDKGSGIDHSEISEVNPFMPWASDWHSATSPYVLHDQTLSSRISIRVYDKKGNVRTESLLAHNAQSTVIYALGLLGAVIIVVLAWLFRRFY